MSEPEFYESGLTDEEWAFFEAEDREAESLDEALRALVTAIANGASYFAIRDAANRLLPQVEAGF